MEDAVALIPRFSREVDLRRQHRLSWRLHLHVDVARAAGIESRHDAVEAVSALGIGELMAAEPVAGVVVLAGIVRLPEVDERARHRAAAAGEHHSRDRQPGAFQAGLEKRGARRRSRREEGTLGLRWRRVVVVRALRRGRQRRPLLHGVAEAELQQVSAGENEGKRDHGAEKPATGLVVGRMLVHRSLTVRVADELKERLTSRSEEHTSELQSQSNLVCRLLLEKKKE